MLSTQGSATLTGTIAEQSREKKKEDVEGESSNAVVGDFLNVLTGRAIAVVVVNAFDGHGKLAHGRTQAAVSIELLSIPRGFCWKSEEPWRCTGRPHRASWGCLPHSAAPLRQYRIPFEWPLRARH